MTLSAEEIEEMCEVIVNCNLKGDELVEYVTEFIKECEGGRQE